MTGEESAMKVVRLLLFAALVLLALGATPRGALACPS
jgi:hypothetical protein